MPSSPTKALLFFLILYLSSLTAFEHVCNHDEIEQNPDFVDIQEDMSSLQQPQDSRLLASPSYPNIRIHVYYDFLKKTASSSYASYVIDELVPPAVDYFESALKLKYPVVGNLVLASNVKKVCEHVTPSILLNEGVPADLFLYYDSEATGGTQIANTKYCFLANGTRRPLVSRTVINRNMLKVANGDVLTHERNMLVIMHEMMHSFGFSGGMFQYYIDENAKTLVGHMKKVKIAGKTRTVIDVPPLTNKLRAYYGCPSLEGAALENGGGSDTASSHFERKFFLYEAMTSGSIGGRRISEFSLSMLEGSGWYVPDYSYAEPFFYGQGQGCGFITGTCGSSKAEFDEFCVGNKRGCAPHGRGGGYCSSDSIMDGCKFYFPTQDYDCENEDGVDNTRLPELQVYGRTAGSKCFTGDLNSRKSSNGQTSFCFKYTCSGSGANTQVEVQVGGKKIVCSREGQQSVDGYYGALDCPDPLTFCNTVGRKYCPRNCMGRGSCVNNKCQCEAGYAGIDCALKA